MTQIINKKEFRFVGLQRSGNHAVINWILSQCKGEKIFLNFAQPYNNPYKTSYQERLLHFCQDFDIYQELQNPSFKD